VETLHVREAQQRRDLVQRQVRTRHETQRQLTT
jgi:hypothetical protein